MSTEPNRRGAVKKWLIRIGVVALLVLAAAGGYLYYVWSGTTTVPTYYAAERLTGDDRLEAIASVERKIGNFQGDLGQAVAAQQSAAVEEEAAAEPVELQFEAAELDTYFEKWLADNGYADAFGKYLAEPRLVLNEGRLVLAGRAEMGGMTSVVSMHFLPSVGEGGQAQLELEGVYAGTVPLPDRAVAPMREKAAAAIDKRLPSYVDDAGFEDNGSANKAAVDLAIDRQLGRILDGLPVEDLILFPPLLNRGPIATRVTDLSIADGVMTLRLVPLAEAERVAYLEAIKADPDGGGRRRRARRGLRRRARRGATGLARGVIGLSIRLSMLSAWRRRTRSTSVTRTGRRGFTAPAASSSTASAKSCSGSRYTARTTCRPRAGC